MHGFLVATSLVVVGGHVANRNTTAVVPWYLHLLNVSHTAAKNNDNAPPHTKIFQQYCIVATVEMLFADARARYQTRRSACLNANRLQESLVNINEQLKTETDRQTDRHDQPPAGHTTTSVPIYSPSGQTKHKRPVVSPNNNLCSSGSRPSAEDTLFVTGMVPHRQYKEG